MSRNAYCSLITSLYPAMLNFALILRTTKDQTIPTDHNNDQFLCLFPYLWFNDSLNSLKMIITVTI